MVKSGGDYSQGVTLSKLNPNFTFTLNPTPSFVAYLLKVAPQKKCNHQYLIGVKQKSAFLIRLSLVSLLPSKVMRPYYLPLFSPQIRTEFTKTSLPIIPNLIRSNRYINKNDKVISSPNRV